MEQIAFKGNDPSHRVRNGHLSRHEDSQEELSINILDYWNIIRKRWRMIVIIFLSTMVITALYTSMMKRVFRGTATIQIDKERQQIVEIKEILAVDQRDMETQLKILTSRSVAGRVVQSLKLAGHPEFISGPQPSRENVKRMPLATQELLIDQFLGGLTIEPIRNTRLAKIHFNSTHPELAKGVPNTLAEIYIQHNLEMRSNAIQQAKILLQEQLVDLKEKLKKAEEALQNFSYEHDIISLHEKENISLQRLLSFNDALTKAESDCITKEVLFEQVTGQDRDSSTSILGNQLVRDLKDRYHQVEAQLKELSKAPKPEDPEIAQMKRQMESIQKQIDAEVNRVITIIKNEYESSLRRELLMRQAFDKQKAKVIKMKDDSIQHNFLNRDVETHKELYRHLLQRMREAEVSSGITASNIFILDRAELPKSPLKPNRRQNLSIAAVVGLFLGMGLAFLLEFLDNTVKTAEDIEKLSYLGVGCLGIVPDLLRENHSHKEDRTPPLIELFTISASHSIFSEAFRNIRTSILLSFPEKPPKSIAVTSCNPSEGKTTIAVNTSIVLSQMGAQVVIIDGDMRNPSVHRIFKDGNEAGLSSFLSGNKELESVIKQTEIPNLYKINSGPIPPNPTELLSSNLFRTAIQTLGKMFDHVIIDCPPVFPFSDVLIVSNSIDGVLMAVWSGVTIKKTVQKAIAALLQVNAKVLGVVVNRLHNYQRDYGYSYNYYYGQDKKKYDLSQKETV